MTTSLFILIALSLLNFVLALMLPESPIRERFLEQKKEGLR
jgi:hypothetical protein